MNICIISNDYPDERRSVFSFVKQLVDEFARQGHTCQVIAPYSITKNKRTHVFKEKQKVGNGEVIIYRPNFLSFSNIKCGNISLTKVFHQMAVDYAFKKLEFRPDIIYCHFWQSGLEGYSYAKEHHIPLFVATGESCISAMFDCRDNCMDFYDYVSGVICVSTKNKNESIQMGLTVDDKCKVFPNGTDDRIFNVSNQSGLKKYLGIKETDFVLAFCGWFNERKGAIRVAQAINKLNDENIKVLFIGKGPHDPQCSGIIFKGTLPHEEIPRYLNCAHAFILPTLAEGCCNAVIEAMSCGLPIISSDREFNRDVLNTDNSILVDPASIDEIAKAITELRDDRVRLKSMARESRKSAENLSIKNRAKNIIEFIESRCS